MQGFSIFLTVWQTLSSLEGFCFLIPPDKGERTAREECSVPSIPDQNLSLQTQACQLTSPGLMSLRALRWSRKLLSGKDASAFGTQLWLPARVKQVQTYDNVFLTTLAVILCWNYRDVIGAYMSFEAEKAQSPRSWESLPFLQRKKGIMHVWPFFLWSSGRLRNSDSSFTAENWNTDNNKQMLAQTIWPLQICSLEAKCTYCRKYCRTEIKLWPFSMSL